MQTAVSQVSTLAARWEQDVPDYAAAACQAVEIWLGKLEQYLETHDVAQARQLLDEHRLQAPVASYQGGLFAADERAAKEHRAHFVRRLVFCRQLGVGTMVIAGDVAGPIAHDDVARIKQALIDAARRAADFGVRLALEFQARAAVANNLQSAVALVTECGEPNLGICLDAFHFYTGPSKTEDLAYLTAENLFHVQLCDVAGVPRELATDADRILPGEGDLPLAAIADALKSIDYRGCVSLEVMNPQIYNVPPRQVAEIGITAVRKALGIARM